MSSTAPELPESPATSLPEPQPTETVPTEPPSQPPTEQPTQPTEDPPTEGPTEQPVPVPPVTSDSPTTDSDPTTEQSPPPASSKSSRTSAVTEEPTETSAPSATSTTDQNVTSTPTSETSNSKPTETVITSVVTSKGETGDLTTIVLTSTGARPTQTVSITGTGTSTTDAGSALQTGGSGSDDSGGGLSPAGTIAVAVVVPVVSVTLIIIGLIIWWRRREANKRSEQQRKSEIEDYGYNPNNDPTLPTVGGSNFGDGSEMREDNSGYRGWGATSNSRKLSTNLSSGPGMGNTGSENGSNRGYHHAGSPSDGTTQFSDGYGGRISGDSETIGALGMGPPTSNNRPNRDIARGPSNASSANSGGHRSEESEDGTLIDGPGGPGYYGDNPYAQPQNTPYGDGPGQPVIRDVTARRNTRIESPSIIPQQGNSGISQNF